MKNTYFDYTATTQVCEKSIEAMNHAMREDIGNPSSLHYKGVESENHLSKVRHLVAQQLHVQAKEIYFTSGGTESNNLAILGAVNGNKRKGKHIISTSFEHASVKETLKALEHEGYRISYLKHFKNGQIDISELISLLCEDTILVTMMHVNNEVGTVLPIKEIGDQIKSYRKDIYFHVDGVQSFMKFPVNCHETKIDFYSASAHKIHGPKGCGFLYVREGSKMSPLFRGGSQEKALRAGTQNVPGIVGLGGAIEDLSSMLHERYQKVLALKEYFTRELEKKLPNYQLNSVASKGIIEEEVASPYVISVQSSSLKGEVILHALEDYKICVSTGSACSSKKLNVSHVLKAIGLTDVESDRSIRISFDPEQSTEDIDYLLLSLETIDRQFGRFVKK